MVNDQNSHNKSVVKKKMGRPKKKRIPMPLTLKEELKRKKEQHKKFLQKNKNKE